MKFEKWLTNIGKSQKTAENYSKAIAGSMSEWARDSGLIANSLLDITSPKEIASLELQLATVSIFMERNRKGNGMYSAALKKYREYLSDVSAEDIAEDIQTVVADKEIPDTDKLTYINARVGQGKFRRDLIDMWQGCAVTGYSDTRFLIASHIMPWKNSDPRQRLDPYNGLLLLPNLDKVFDLGYLTFTEKGRIKISESIENPDVLSIKSDMSIHLEKQHQDYMAYHRNYVFENNL